MENSYFNYTKPRLEPEINGLQVTLAGNWAYISHILNFINSRLYRIKTDKSVYDENSASINIFFSR